MAQLAEVALVTNVYNTEDYYDTLIEFQEGLAQSPDVAQKIAALKRSKASEESMKRAL